MAGGGGGGVEGRNTLAWATRPRKVSYISHTASVGAVQSAPGTVPAWTGPVFSGFESLNNFSALNFRGARFSDAFFIFYLYIYVVVFPKCVSSLLFFFFFFFFFFFSSFFLLQFLITVFLLCFVCFLLVFF